LRGIASREIVSYQGQYHTIPEAGLNPLPVRRSIPVWLGGSADALLRRVARIGDGWLPQERPDEQMRETLERLRSYTREAGRDPGAVGIEARMNARNGTLDEWVRQTEGWRALGATHISINTMGASFTSLDEHIDAIRRYKEAVSG
jgi:alkanesulfonate monooxygenase SsuD/methylene tetrahydromethanopterin reductase-like flavin-dependent oxidoreductase (luciferase family)